MCEQLKWIWKTLLWGIFLLPLTAEVVGKNPLDSVRVIERDGKRVLQTVILSYKKDEVTLDLVGAVHLGEKQYFQTLNKKLGEYDAVFYEMVGGKPPKKKGKSEASPLKGELGAVSQMYNVYTRLLQLELQKDFIDYHQAHFIHADMTLREFKKAQKNSGDSLGEEVLKGADLSLLEDIDQASMMAAMISGDSTKLKHTFMSLLGKADDSLSKKDDTTVIIRKRNEKCLSVMQEKLSGKLHPEKVAIFYGAAHFLDFHKQLTEKGWSPTGESWVDAWMVEKEE